jgi:hypothetical protein
MVMSANRSKEEKHAPGETFFVSRGSQHTHAAVSVASAEKRSTSVSERQLLMLWTFERKVRRYLMLSIETDEMLPMRCAL